MEVLEEETTMGRREAWKGTSPESHAAARTRLLEAAQACIERHGFSKVTLSDVAAAAGVTRPTVYRYFGSAEELFNAAAVTASGGYLERLRSRKTLPQTHRMPFGSPSN